MTTSYSRLVGLVPPGFRLALGFSASAAADLAFRRPAKAATIAPSVASETRVTHAVAELAAALWSRLPSPLRASARVTPPLAATLDSDREHSDVPPSQALPFPLAASGDPGHDHAVTLSAARASPLSSLALFASSAFGRAPAGATNRFQPAGILASRRDKEPAAAALEGRPPAPVPQVSRPFVRQSAADQRAPSDHQEQVAALPRVTSDERDGHDKSPSIEQTRQQLQQQQQQEQPPSPLTMSTTQVAVETETADRAASAGPSTLQTGPLAPTDINRLILEELRVIRTFLQQLAEQRGSPFAPAGQLPPTTVASHRSRQPTDADVQGVAAAATAAGLTSMPGAQQAAPTAAHGHHRPTGRRARRSARRGRRSPDDGGDSSSSSSSSFSGSTSSRDDDSDDEYGSQGSGQQADRHRHHRRRHRARPPLPPFSPNSVQGWLRAVEAFRNEYHPQAVLRAVVKSLGEHYYEFLQSTGKVPARVGQITREIRHRYDFKDSEHAESALRAMRQREGESTADFVIRTVAVARKAARDNYAERRMVRVIIDGCAQPMRGWLLLLTPPPTSFRELERAARNYDLAFGLPTGPGGVPEDAASSASSTSATDTETPARSRRRRRSRRKKAAPTTTPHVFGEIPRPPRPCKWCNGDHWNSECPLRAQAATVTATTQPRQPAAAAPSQQPLVLPRSSAATSSTTVCTRCRHFGHSAETCLTLLCSHCLWPGHRADQCQFASPPTGAAQSSASTRDIAAPTLGVAMAQVRPTAHQATTGSAPPLELLGPFSG